MSGIDIWWASWWGKTAAFVALSALAGGLGYLMRAIDDKEKSTVGRTVLEIVSAGFVGLLFKLVCDEMGLSDRLTGVIVGLAGWLGASASIRIIERFVYDKLGLDKPAESET